MKTTEPTLKHILLMCEFKDVLQRNAQNLSAQDMLAIAAQLVGNIIARQDQTKMTPAMAMELVCANIEIGNAVAIEGVMGTPAGAA